METKYEALLSQRKRMKKLTIKIESSIPVKPDKLIGIIKKLVTSGITDVRGGAEAPKWRCC